MKSKALRIIFLTIGGTGFFAISPGQHAYSQQPLEAYVEEGLKNNLVVSQKEISVKQAENALQVARTYFMPSVTFLGDYLSGRGGRSIDLPIGDLLNPVYASLNQLTSSDRFPMVENVRQDFFPYDQYDARVRTSIPVINTDLMLNRTIQQQQTGLREYEVQLYKRQLVYEIKSAYFNYLNSLEAVKIYESALELVSKNVELNESLVRNGSGLPANLMRSRSEFEKLKAELNSTQNLSQNAKRYFNFLLNRELDSEVNSDFRWNENRVLETDGTGQNEREEIHILRAAQQINTSSLRLNRLSRVPKVNAFLDLGSQAMGWEFNDQSRYFLAGVQVSFPLFQGFRTNLNIRNSELAIERLGTEIKHTENGLKLSRINAGNELATATRNYAAAKEQLRSAESYFKLIEKGFQQGVNSLIEFIDARNQLTTSQLQVNVAAFNMLTAEAKVEREAASYSLPN